MFVRTRFTGKTHLTIPVLPSSPRLGCLRIAGTLKAAISAKRARIPVPTKHDPTVSGTEREEGGEGRPQYGGGTPHSFEIAGRGGDSGHVCKSLTAIRAACSWIITNDPSPTHPNRMGTGKTQERRPEAAAEGKEDEPENKTAAGDMEDEPEDKAAAEGKGGEPENEPAEATVETEDGGGCDARGTLYRTSWNGLCRHALLGAHLNLGHQVGILSAGMSCRQGGFLGQGDTPSRWPRGRANTPENPWKKGRFKKPHATNLDFASHFASR